MGISGILGQGALTVGNEALDLEPLGFPLAEMEEILSL